MKALYFSSFYFRVFNSIHEIRKNKNLAKISTYTVDGLKNPKQHLLFVLFLNIFSNYWHKFQI